MTPASSRFLIVNADDFGKAAAINDGIRGAHQGGIVTSASLMVHWRAATDAALYARSAPALSVGLHVDLGEWFYDGRHWVERYQVVDVNDHSAVAGEVVEQLGRFQALMGRAPSHLDSHQHTHRREPVRSLLLEFAHRLGVPLRHHSHVRYEGAFYGQSSRGEPYPQAITVEALLDIIDRLPEGWTELDCHPALEAVDDVYGPERAQELETLCDPRVRSRLNAADVELRTFNDVASSGP